MTGIQNKTSSGISLKAFKSDKGPDSEKDLLTSKISSILPDRIIHKPQEQHTPISLEIVVEKRETSDLLAQAQVAIQKNDHRLLSDILDKVPFLSLTDFVNTVDNKGNTLLLQCAHANSIACMGILLDAGAKYSQVDARGNSFVHLAVWQGSSELLAAFLSKVPEREHETLLRMKDKMGYTPLLQCALSESGNVNCLNILLKNGAAYNEETIKGMTFVHFAIRMGRTELLGSYLNSISKENARKMVNTPDKQGNFPLIQAISFAGKKNSAFLELLFKAGADYRATDANGENFVHWTVKEGHFGFLKDFLESLTATDRVIAVNAKDKKGNTPLFKCCNAKEGNKSLQLLLAAGADPLVLNKEGDSPYHEALFHQKDELAEILLKAEPKVEGLVIPNLLGHMFGFSLQVPFKGEKTSNGSHAFLMHKEIVDDLQRPGVREGAFSECMNAQYRELTSAFTQSAIKTPTQAEIAQTSADIQAGKLVIVSSGWKGHAITHVFKDGYHIICNRGNGAGIRGTFVAYKIDPSKMTPGIVGKLVKKDFSETHGLAYYYELLPKLLEGTKDEFCKQLQEVSPKLSKSGVCGYAAGKAALRAALALITHDPKLAKTISKSWATGHRHRTLARFEKTPSPFEKTVLEDIVNKQIKRRLHWRESGMSLSSLTVSSQTESSPSPELQSGKQASKDDSAMKKKRIASALFSALKKRKTPPVEQGNLSKILKADPLGLT
jgi:ankyrin repeat protein